MKKEKIRAAAREIKNFIADESGYLTAENILWIVLGAFSSAFVITGFISSLRGKMGDIVEDTTDMKAMDTPVDGKSDYGFTYESGKTGMPLKVAGTSEE